MLIGEYMSLNPITVDQECSLEKAAAMMKKYGIRRFPVVEGGKLIGVVTDRDIRSAAPSQVATFKEKEKELTPELHDMLKEITVRDIMSKDVITVQPNRSVITAASVMLKEAISGLPVVDSRGSVIGIITVKDVFKVLVNFSGIKLGRTVFAFQLEDRPGTMKEVADVIREHGGRLAGIFTSYYTDDPRYRRVYIRIKDFPEDKLSNLKKDLEGKFNLLYMIQDDLIELEDVDMLVRKNV
jgi:acetoin utilization protein AcuB